MLMSKCAAIHMKYLQTMTLLYVQNMTLPNTKGKKWKVHKVSGLFPSLRLIQKKIIKEKWIVVKKKKKRKLYIQRNLIEKYLY